MNVSMPAAASMLCNIAMRCCSSSGQIHLFRATHVTILAACAVPSMLCQLCDFMECRIFELKRRDVYSEESPCRSANLAASVGLLILLKCA